jgi:6-phosphogluconolactonase
MINIFEDIEALSARAAELFASVARESVQEKDSFFVALAGGMTPRRMYEKLAQPEIRDQIPWEKVHIFWSDERLVPHDDAQSNYRMTKEALLDHVPVRHVFSIPFSDSADASAHFYEAELHTVFKTLPRFDLCFLGMGADGHTASLFPRSSVLHETERWVCPARSLSGGPERVTLTYPVINNTAKICFLVTGEDKAMTLKQVIENADHTVHYPAQDVRPTNGDLIWLLDRAAAKYLTTNEK